MTRTVFIILLVTLLAYGLAVRLYDLTADPPAYFAGGSQDLTTDGSYLTLYAKNTVQFNQWNPLGYEPWAQFKISIISAVSYLLFLITGVTRYASNLTGMLLSVLGLTMFLAGLSRTLSRGALVVTAALLSASYLLVVFGRAAMAENGLIFLAGAAYFAYSYWFETSWGKILLGVLIALAALLGKSFGFLLAAGPLIYLATSDRKRLLPHAALVVAPIVVVTIAFTLIFYHGSSLFSFLYEHGVGEHGRPFGLTSPKAYIETLVAFGRIGVYRFESLASLLALAFLLVTVTYPSKAGSEPNRDRVFLITWVVVWILALAPFNYRPPRYALPMILPMAALAGLFFDRIGSAVRTKAAKLTWWRVLIVLMLFWHLCFALADAWISSAMDVFTITKEVWYSLPVAAVLTFAWVLLTRKWQLRSIQPIHQLAFLVAILVLSLVAQGRLLYPWYSNFTHTIDEANRDLPVILGPNAVVAGQYGPALTEETALQGFPLFVSSTGASDRNILETYPVTHVALSSGDWQPLTEKLPELKQAQIISRYWVRDNIVYLVRIAGLFNRVSAAYQPSAYERALSAIASGDRNSALRELYGVVQAYPGAKSPAIELYHLAAVPENLPGLRPLIDSLVESNASDFTVNALAAVYYKYASQFAPAQFSLETAESFHRRALELSPPNQGVVEKSFQTYTPSDRIIP